MAIYAERGVVGLSIPTPFAVGPVNVFLIDDEPLTLVDTGANTATTFLDVRAALRESGHELADLGRIVVTHQHLDHAGLIGPLAAASGAEVCAIAGLDAWLRDGPAANDDDERFSFDLMAAHGAPAAQVATFDGARRGLSGFASSVPEVRAMADGEELDFAGGALRVHHQPGHSPFDTVLEDPDAGLLIVGDAIFAEHPATVLPSAPGPGLPADDPARSSLFAAGRRALRWFAASDAAVALPGHGEPIEAPGKVAREYERQAESCAERVRGELAAVDRATAYELAARLHPRAVRRQPFHALCPVLESLDLLREEGLVVEGEDDGVRWFACR